MAGKTPEQRVWDLFVYLPAGALLELGDEVGALVEKGRRRYEGQVQSAKLIGQLAVSMGTREARRRLDQVRKEGARTVSEAVEPLSHQVSALMGLLSGSKGVPAVEKTLASNEAPASEQPLDNSVPLGRRSPPAPSGDLVPEASRLEAAEAGSSVRPVSLPIPDYDLLAASQVVRRLEALSSTEREEIRRYERQGRARRTILNRLDQLDEELSGSSRPGSLSGTKPVKPGTSVSKQTRANRRATRGVTRRPANGARRSGGRARG